MTTTANFFPCQVQKVVVDFRERRRTQLPQVNRSTAVEPLGNTHSHAFSPKAAKTGRRFQAATYDKDGQPQPHTYAHHLP